MTTKLRRTLLRTVPLLLGSLFMAASAAAHPHVWVDMKTELLFDDVGRLTGFRHHWRFDEGYSTFAVMGLDTDQDGTLSREELDPLAKVNMESLNEFDYFTFLSQGEQGYALSDPVDYSVTYDNGRAELHFTLPLLAPLDPKSLDKDKGDLSFDIYDPTAFVDFSYVKDKPIVLAAKAPAGCHTDYQPPVAVDRTARSLADAVANADPEAALDFAKGGATTVHLICDEKGVGK